MAQPTEPNERLSRPTSQLRPYNSLPGQMPPATSDPPPARLLSFNHRRREGSMMAPFAGRLGGNLEFVVDRSDPDNADLLTKIPDAAPNLTLDETFDMRAFKELDLYKAALIEFVGTLIFAWASAWNSISPNTPPPPPSATAGPFSRSYFLGPLVAAVLNSILLSLLIFSFGATSGAHMNPLITVGTFFARLTTFPRMVLYIAAQMSGAALAGLLLRAGAGTRDFKVGGCYLFEDMAKASQAFTIEVIGDLLVLFLAFGVGLDPRQRDIFGPALGPIFVGLTVGAVALCTAFSLPGYGGAGLNAARCFGVFVGSRFPSWHWVHWVALFTASTFHGLIYFLVPPATPTHSADPRAKAVSREKATLRGNREKEGRDSV